MTGDAFTSRSAQVLATNGELHDQMLDVIRGHRESPRRTTVD
jgi:hypothetical protein